MILDRTAKFINLIKLYTLCRASQALWQSTAATTEPLMLISKGLTVSGAGGEAEMRSRWETG
jgi:hypothetical protein